LIGAVQAHDERAAFSGFTIAVRYHGKLSNGSANDFTRSLTKLPDGLKATGTGVVFYMGASDDGRISSSSTLDLSGIVPDGLFVNIVATWDASRVKVEDVGQLMRRHGEQILALVGLNPVWAK